MKSKYLAILAIIASLIILMFSLSVVSAAVANGENNDVFSVDGNQSISQSSVSILNNDSDKLDEISSLKSGNCSNDSSKIKAVIKASYKNKKISVTVVDKNNKPLKNVNVHLDVHASYARGLVKMADAKTDAQGKTSFNVDDLNKDGNYEAHLTLDDEIYDCDMKDIEYTLKEAHIKASYISKKKQVYAHVVDKNNKPLKNVNVHLEMHASYARGLVKMADAKTNAKGDVYFDVSGLKKAGTYYVGIGTLDDKYSVDFKDLEYTIKKQSKMGDKYPDTHKFNKDKINNKQNNTNEQNNTNDVNMRNTGIPILGLLLVLFTIFGVSYRKD